MTDIPEATMKMADDLLAEEYGTDHPIDPGLARLVARAIMAAQAEQREKDEERERRLIEALEEARDWLASGPSETEVEWGGYLEKIDATLKAPPLPTMDERQ